MTQNDTRRPHRSDMRSRSLDLLRYPLALVVLAVHTCGSSSQAVDAVPWLARFVAAFLTDQSVPVYFFIAGYVFFLNVSLTREVYTRKLRNRVRSLLVPYVLWNVAAFAVVACYQGGIDSADTLVRGLGAALIGTSGAPGGLVFPADSPMWFVRDLMVMGVAAPALAWLFRHTGAWCVVAAGIIWALPATRHWGGWQLQEAAFFFSWGAWMSHGSRDMMAEFRRMRIPSLVAYPAAATGALVLAPTHPQAAFWCKTAAIVAGLYFAYNAAAACVERGHMQWASRLAPAAFFVYCSHVILLPPAGSLWLRVLTPSTPAAASLFLALQAATVAALSTAAFFAMRRYAPRVLAPFVGGRV
ncbi:MAG: acyltransferase [Muribaculaceae bacterium]|nr:acyltransferase [Muribaculaceae bacterium]